MILYLPMSAIKRGDLDALEKNWTLAFAKNKFGTYLTFKNGVRAYFASGKGGF
jgi:hypothetical protein